MEVIKQLLIKKYLKEIQQQVDKEMIELGLLKIEGKEKIYARGSCNIQWGIQKRLLKEKYNIEWKTPAEENPDIIYD